MKIAKVKYDRRKREGISDVFFGCYIDEESDSFLRLFCLVNKKTRSILARDILLNWKYSQGTTTDLANKLRRILMRKYKKTKRRYSSFDDFVISVEKELIHKKINPSTISLIIKGIKNAENNEQSKII